MMTLPPSVKIYVAAQPVDARKSFDGLSSLVQCAFGKDPLSGHLFVFINRRGDQIQMLFWDRNGFSILKKRLEAGTFRLARAPEQGAVEVEISAGDLALLLEGIELAGATRRKRYRHAAPLAVGH
jgi:transposase